MAFCADEGVTLSEAATVLNRLLRVTDVDLSDYDAGSADAWSAQAVANLESVRVIESGSFSAGDWQRPLTRGEAAQLLSAAMTLAEKKQESAGLLFGLIPMTRRKALAEFRVRRRESDMIRFLPRPVRGRKHVARSKASNCPLSADNRRRRAQRKCFAKRKRGGRPPFCLYFARRCAKVYSDKIA